MRHQFRSMDPFEDVLNLEDKYFEEGYKQGYEDGALAGKIEGRSVGLKKGYEKFLEAGRLQSKSIVWANRMPNIRSQTQPNWTSALDSQPNSIATNTTLQTQALPALNSNARLEKNVTMLYALVEPGTLSTENSDEAVNDFDDRIKRAQGKLKIVERSTGEAQSSSTSDENQVGQKNETIEDARRIMQRPNASGPR